MNEDMRPATEIKEAACGWNDGAPEIPDSMQGLHNQYLILEVLLDIRDLLAKTPESE